MGLRALYEVQSPYPQDRLGGIDHAQTADVMYLAHLGYDPYKVSRFGHTDWRFSTVTFGPTVAAPVGSSVAATTPNTTGIFMTTQQYAVTSIKDTSPVQESRASAVISVSNDLSLSGNFNTITVPAPSGDVSRHVVYKEQGGVFGYIGSTDGTTIEDHGIQPLLSETPPQGNNPFTGDGNKPGTVTFHQQRLLFGGTLNIINGVWASRSADPENMDFSRPSRADDALSFALVAEKVNGITGFSSTETLLCLTTDGVFAAQGGGQAGIITPSEINPKRTSGRGGRKVKPLLVDSVTFFVTSRSNAVRTLGFSFDIQGYKSDNVTIFAPHLFKQFAPVKLVYQEEPFSCIYALRSDGALLAFTWEAEQEVWGWSQIETDGVFEDIEVIPESGYDRLYARIRRTFAGVERVFHERMALPHIDIEMACHLDCAYTQTYDTPSSRITGAFHLVGQKVSMIYDGYVAHDLDVDPCDGGVDIPDGNTASSITIGLRYSGRLETLPAALASGLASNQVNRQQIGDLVVRTVDTRGIEIGSSGTPLEQVEPKDGDEAQDLLDVGVIDYRVDVPGDWRDSTTIVIEQNEPLPAHVVAIFAKMLTADD
jgi:hypothetical protein